MSLSLFDDSMWSLSAPFFSHHPLSRRGQHPTAELSRFGATDVTEKDDGSLEFHVDAPGLAKEDFDIQVSPENVLTISGSRSTHASSEDSAEAEGAADGDKPTLRWSERSSSSFTRQFRLPQTAKVDEIKASAENGVLTLSVPGGAAKPQPRKIAIQ
eukprot:m.46796 g.46796  ORF g.46796 m.46796 type:complete len:157 (-) comp8800_c0_seq2:2153-2623(-)